MNQNVAMWITEDLEIQLPEADHNVVNSELLMFNSMPDAHPLHELVAIFGWYE